MSSSSIDLLEPDLISNWAAFNIISIVKFLYMASESIQIWIVEIHMMATESFRHPRIVESAIACSKNQDISIFPEYEP